MRLQRVLLVSLVVTGLSVSAASLLNACPPDPNNLPPGSGYLEPGQKKCVTDPDKGTICGIFPKRIPGKSLSPLKNRNTADRIKNGKLSLRQSHLAHAQFRGKFDKGPSKPRVSARQSRHGQTGMHRRNSRR